MVHRVVIRGISVPTVWYVSVTTDVVMFGGGENGGRIGVGGGGL